MLQDIYYSRKTNKAVQIISECKIMPEQTEAICFQELTEGFSVYAIEKKTFFELYCKRVGNVTRKNDYMEQVEERYNREPEEKEQIETSGLLRFLDADTYRDKIKILEGMKDELDDHILNNMAVSLDLSIEDGVDGYSFIMSELRIRSRFEGKRGDRL